MPADSFLPAIGHAVSGAAGTAISTTATYPLDLVNTRLKVQRQLRRDGTIPESEGQYRGVADALVRIASREEQQEGHQDGTGGLGALYAGLGSDVAKGVADSFLFFLFYSWFRSRAAAAGTGSSSNSSSSRRLSAWQELAVGAAAGACSRLFTTPIGNVVTRKQTASLMMSGDAGRRAPQELSVGEILGAIRAEKGILGLWAGYSATLVLTLNPSITFYLQNVLRKVVVDSGREGDSGAATFLVAAVSKVVATAVTYPFQIAKAISQVSAPESKKSEGGGDVQDSKNKADGISHRLHRIADESIFATVYKLGRTEGIPALYDGLGGELLKAFLNHGTTMLSKDVVHKLVVQLYFFILAFIRRSPAAQALLRRRSREEFLRRFGKVQIAEKFARIKDRALVLDLVGRAQNLIVTR